MTAERSPEALRVFVTGGCGLVGSHLARALRRAGHEALLYDALLCWAPCPLRERERLLRARTEGLRDDPWVRIVEGDVRDRAGLRRVMSAWRPDVVVHLAAMPRPADVARHPEEAVEINVEGTAATLDAARSVGSVRRVVFVSSSYVYGHFQSQVADEEHPLHPVDLYGTTKLSGEALTRACGRGVEHVVVRPTAAYGFGDVNARVVQCLVESALSGRPMELHDAGRAVLDFTDVRDLAEGLLRCVVAPAAANETFNLARGQGRSVRELAEVVRRLVPGPAPTGVPAETVRPGRGALSIEKARRVLGFAPAIDLERGVADYLSAMHALERAA